MEVCADVAATLAGGAQDLAFLVVEGFADDALDAVVAEVMPTLWHDMRRKSITLAIISLHANRADEIEVRIWSIVGRNVADRLVWGML